jgi:hypothetical protein
MDEDMQASVARSGELVDLGSGPHGMNVGRPREFDIRRALQAEDQESFAAHQIVHQVNRSLLANNQRHDRVGEDYRPAPERKDGQQLGQGRRCVCDLGLNHHL